MRLREVQVLFDSVSERRLLRLCFYQPVVPVAAVRLEILLRDVRLRPIAVLRDLPLPEDAIDGSGALRLERYAILLPDGAEGGDVRATYVAFADGLDWEKSARPWQFTTDGQEKADVAFYCATVGAREEEISDRLAGRLTYPPRRPDVCIRSIDLCGGEDPALTVTYGNNGGTVVRLARLSARYLDGEGNEQATEEMEVAAVLQPSATSAEVRLPLPAGVEEGVLVLRVSESEDGETAVSDSAFFASYDVMRRRAREWMLSPDRIPAPLTVAPRATAWVDPEKDPSDESISPEEIFAPQPEKSNPLPLFLAIVAAMVAAVLLIVMLM